MHMKTCFQQGLLAAMVISLVACGGGGGGGGDKKSSAPSSVAPSSTAASSVAPSSTPASSVAPSSKQTSSSVASSSVVSSLAQSSSNSSIVSGVTTTFNVSITPPQLGVNAPVTKPGRSAVAKKIAQEALPLNQLAVVIVDVSGKVQQTIPLVEGKNAWQNADGTWTLNIPGYPRLDCVVIANLDGPVTLVNGNSLFDAYPDALLSPTTSNNLEVSLAATAAYQNLLDDLGGEGTFASLNVDVNDPAQLSAIQSLIDTIAEVLDGQAYIGATSIAQALAAVQEQVTSIVQVEVKNIQNQVDSTVNTVAKGVEAGGVFWFEGDEPSAINYGGFTALNVPEQARHYDGFGFVPPELEDWGTVVLTSTGWVVTRDVSELSALNQDGSVTLSNTQAKVDSTNVKASQVINLSGRNMADFFGASSGTRGIASQINPAATFTEGSLAYRTNLTATNESYVLWYDPGYDSDTNDSTDAPLCFGDIDGDHLPDPVSEFGGNCQTPSAYAWTADQTERKGVSNMTSLDQLLSADVAPGTVGAKLILINGIGVQLVNDANKTARYFLLPNWGFDSPTLIGTGTWAEQDLPNLTVDAAAIIVDVPPRIAKYEFDADEQHIFFTKQNGLIRRGNRTSEGTLVEAGVLLFNQAAKNNLLAAFDYQPAIAGAWVLGNDYFVFRKDGTFAQVKTSTDDPNCQAGFAHGQYSWNPTTGAFSVDIDEDTTAKLPQDSCSLVDVETVAIAGNTMTATDDVGTVELTKITPSEAAPLAGVWVAGGDLFTFTGDNKFVHVKLETSDSNCQVGWANGSFTWDQATGELIGTVLQDFTDNDPVTSCSLEEVDALLNGNSLQVKADGDEFTMKRFGN